MIIEYYKKNVYGNELFYVKDSKQAMLLFILTGRKTINEKDIDVLGELGFTMTQVINN